MLADQLIRRTYRIPILPLEDLVHMPNARNIFDLKLKDVNTFKDVANSMFMHNHPIVEFAYGRKREWQPSYVTQSGLKLYHGRILTYKGITNKEKELILEFMDQNNEYYSVPINLEGKPRFAFLLSTNPCFREEGLYIAHNNLSTRNPWATSQRQEHIYLNTIGNP